MTDECVRNRRPAAMLTVKGGRGLAGSGVIGPDHLTFVASFAKSRDRVSHSNVGHFNLKLDLPELLPCQCPCHVQTATGEEHIATTICAQCQRPQLECNIHPTGNQIIDVVRRGRTGNDTNMTHLHNIGVSRNR